MNSKWIKGLVAVSALGLALQANAGTFGTNVTISDGNGSGTGWWGGREDQEVEPGMVRHQKWDLEGTFVNDNVLTLVGGYDFVNGEGEGSGHFDSGDLFLSTGTPIYGDIHRGGSHGYKSEKNKYGYNYVLDLDFGTGSFDIVAIDEDSDVLGAWYQQNEGSSPWRYESGGTIVGSGSLNVESGLTDSDTGFLGGDHYAMSLDLTELYAQLGESTTFYSHFTMGCGNDNLMGNWTVVPEPATFALFGMGVFGLLIARRKSGSAAIA